MPYKNYKKQIKSCRKYKKLHKEQILQQAKIYYKKNKKRILKIMKKYRSKHKNEKNQYEVEQRRINISCRLLHNLRTRIVRALRGNPKLSTTMKLVGCSIIFLKRYLQKQFTVGMTWKNYGKWHVDHKIPCCQFDLSKEFEQRKCFHWTNLQPLWARENLRKGRK